MREVEAQREPDVPVGDHNTLIHPYVMQQLNHMRDRITQQNRTMEMMWGRWERMIEGEKWVRETYPEIIAQHDAIEDLKRASMSEGVALKMGTHPYAQAIPKASGQAVKYEVGNGTL